MKKTALAATLGLASLVAVAIVAAPAASGAVPGCVPAGNVQVINDDSGSMISTDPTKERVHATELLLKGIPGKTFSGVEFGSEAAVYGSTPGVTPPPAAVPSDPTGLVNQITGATNDNGATPEIPNSGALTNYVAAFQVANAHAPKTNVRIFLTDGEPTVGGDYQNTSPTPRTFVIGFGSSALNPTDGARLQKIATDTGGKYFPSTDASNLNTAMAEILSAINCETPPVKFVDNFTTQGQTIGHTTPVQRGKTAIIRITWPNTQSRFTILNKSFVATLRGKRVNIAKRRKVKPKKLRITRQTGATFEQISVKGIKGSVLKFKVSATQLALPTTATTQVSIR